MKIKLAIVYGVMIWVLTHVLTGIINPIFNKNLPYFNMIIPIITIIVTGFFGILYIRNINENEVVEGVLVGAVFCAIYLILELIFLILMRPGFFIPNYPLNIASMIMIILFITTLLGYLAQMEINLK